MVSNIPDRDDIVAQAFEQHKQSNGTHPDPASIAEIEDIATAAIQARRSEFAGFVLVVSLCVNAVLITFIAVAWVSGARFGESIEDRAADTIQREIQRELNNDGEL